MTTEVDRADQNMPQAIDSEKTRFPWLSSSWTFALRSVVRQRSRNFLLGIMIVFSSLVISYYSQFLQGVTKNFSSNLIGIATGDFYIASALEDGKEANIFERDFEYLRVTDQQLMELESFEEINEALPRLDFQVKISTDLDTFGYRMMSFDAEKDTRLINNFKFIEGRMFEPDEYAIILPYEYANRNKIKVGDQIRVLANSVDKRINLIDYTVAGLFGTETLSAWFDSYAYLSIDRARELVNDQGAVTRVNITLNDDADTESVRNILTDWMDINIDILQIQDEVNISYWREGTILFEQLIEALQLSYTVVISFIVILIATSLAFSTMINIFERTKEIATLSALGAAPRDIRSLMVKESFILSITASLIGIALCLILFVITSAVGIPITNDELAGFVGSSNFYPAVNYAGLIAGLLIPVVISFLASFFFAHRATRLSICDALADR